MQNKKLKPDEKQLLALFADMSDGSKLSLLDFAAFLVTKNDGSIDSAVANTVQPALPIDIQATEKESVIAVIRRLSKTYPMLESSLMLDETSRLMSAHVLQGEPIDEVVEKLNKVFTDYYQKYVDSFNLD